MDLSRAWCLRPISIWTQLLKDSTSFTSDGSVQSLYKNRILSLAAGHLLYLYLDSMSVLTCCLFTVVQAITFLTWLVWMNGVGM